MYEQIRAFLISFCPQKALLAVGCSSNFFMQEISTDEHNWSYVFCIFIVCVEGLSVNAKISDYI